MVRTVDSVVQFTKDKAPKAPTSPTSAMDDNVRTNIRKNKYYRGHELHPSPPPPPPTGECVKKTVYFAWIL